MMRTRILIVILLAFLTTGCLTVSPSGDYTLPAGRTLRGDFIMTSGNATLENGSRVTGDVIMTSGTLQVDGQVDGSILYTSAEGIHLGPNAAIGGDIRGTSGKIYQGDGAVVAGRILDNQTFTVGAGFFAKVLGLLCGLPLTLVGAGVFLAFRRRNAKVPASPPTAQSKPLDLTEKLKQLKRMQDEGLIDETDYTAKKTALLAEL